MGTYISTSIQFFQLLVTSISLFPKMSNFSAFHLFIQKWKRHLFRAFYISLSLLTAVRSQSSHQYSSTDYLIKTFDNGLLMLIFMVFWILANYAKSWINLPSWSLIKYGLPVTRLAVQSSTIIAFNELVVDFANYQ